MNIVFALTYIIILNNKGTVIRDNKVVTDTKIAAYSFSLLYFSANMEVIAEAGMAVIIITAFMAFELMPTIKNTRYIIIGMIISLIIIP